MLVSSLVCLIRDGSMLINAALKPCGASSVLMGFTQLNGQDATTRRGEKFSFGSFFAALSQDFVDRYLQAIPQADGKCETT